MPVDFIDQLVQRGGKRLPNRQRQLRQLGIDQVSRRRIAALFHRAENLRKYRMLELWGCVGGGAGAIGRLKTSSVRKIANSGHRMIPSVSDGSRTPRTADEIVATHALIRGGVSSEVPDGFLDEATLQKPVRAMTRIIGCDARGLRRK